MGIVNAFLKPGYNGNRVKVARYDYDFAVLGGVQGTLALTPASGGIIPSGARVVGGFICVSTAVTSAGSATVAVQVEAAGDIVATTGKASWSLGDKNILPADTSGSITAATIVKTTAARDVSIVIATADLTAGKFQVVLQFIDPLS